ncbi:MAG: YHS domain-containing protein [Anaerolineae bacterium]|nr:YHS domain-containing protein [Anaerolineae bacterium]
MEGNLPRDPVCGLEIHPDDVDSWVEYGGTQYFFCCPECRRAFEESPEEYIARERPKPDEKHSEETGTRHTRHQARI